jgi:glycosyltransferase involved in cell wall biosynthesis
VTTHRPPELVCGPGLAASELLRRLGDLVGAPDAPATVVVRAEHVAIADHAAALLAAGCDEPLVASASAVPSAAAPADSVVTTSLHPLLPPPPTVLLPATSVCALRIEALRSLGPLPRSNGSWSDAIVAVAQRLTDAGWRHVVTPGVAHRWDAGVSPSTDEAAWNATTVAAVAMAHAGLDAHRMWADTRLRPVRVVIDGQCVSDDLHNGTQVVVVNVARWLARLRPDAVVSLAVPDRHHDVARRLVSGDGVEVIARRGGASFDVAYRPYQSIDPNDARWFAEAAERTLIGQLDMIGYSNPSYHPSPALFHTVRNLQRHMMRTADGVTFISAFGRDIALGECPELAPHRLHVVGCGVDVEPAPAAAAPAALAGIGPFIACLSATFRHKNRGHAIRTFGELCARHGYTGSLVIAGPEPYYGRSTDTDAELVAGLPADVASRIRTIGHVDAATKWWLLRTADVVLYPSVVEGFGLVPFEAASVGTPSLSYDGTGLHEVLGAPPALVAGWDPGEWADRVHRLVTSDEASSECVDAVLAAAGQQGWADVAERTWLAIDAALALPSVRHRDEGAVWSRVEPPAGAGVRAASARHLVNRGRAVLARRIAPLLARVRRG